MRCRCMLHHSRVVTSVQVVLKVPCNHATDLIQGPLLIIELIECMANHVPICPRCPRSAPTALALASVSFGDVRPVEVIFLLPLDLSVWRESEERANSLRNAVGERGLCHLIEEVYKDASLIYRMRLRAISSSSAGSVHAC